ncbi:protein sorting-associated protein VTA1 homolog [Seminavis robusta]|uniref:Protein sorting-associated protein VTA1 homolog n=1 Tax=Seminavis robusta TaxID=568900 RepID=A0A9N8HKY4_9STRA|nr:protein sorting-associated protein VTA1 homolog [Seminavis robusta]|eukprot:Sro768_g199670.1 protein sorting-associated protein VTA1 homolog (391) ;mRNA; r:33752-34924
MSKRHNPFRVDNQSYKRPKQEETIATTTRPQRRNNNNLTNMALSIPPELKKISPYIRRAEELDKDTGVAESRLVAYYCRQYAVHLGIPLASASPAAKTCLGVLLGTLETEKPAMDNFTRDEAKFLCQSFAERVFNKADEEDRQGVANKGTAKTFYAAASFLQILDQFLEEGDPEADEIKKKVVYSKWKSTEILKAIKEGRTPTPGGYEVEEEEKEEKDEEATNTPADEPGPIPKVETVQDDDDDALPLPPPPPMPPTAPMEPPTADDEEAEEEAEEGTEIALEPPPVYPGESTTESSTSFVVAPPPSPSPPPPPAQPSPPRAVAPPPAPPKKSGGIFGFGSKKNKNNGKASKAQITDAMELTKFALAALEEKDADLAATRLQQALETLGR